ncbi:uncharacterized protein KY384_006637 [Bacidia gigantensis]|uniref:uncharacterized protein n=1 Tax=Bacidia gigantensis TaxID=2732470 RepID=UPI001D03CE6C|nr:uncharacterized protein KY384_006637 [Bacidia gigantensis]KAG8528948.1 hypothetical protein KY384_006637 [Bacidia gigantensis]
MSCQPGSELVYSPFTPYSQSEYFKYTGGTNNGCWWTIICLIAQADEARKKQFDAIALVMGLVPLTLKDVAWPERRVIAVSRQLPAIVEAIVRALGVVPWNDADFFAKQRAMSSSSLYHRAISMSYKNIRLSLSMCTSGLVVTYAALAVIEVYSKRSVLACERPVFIVTWHLGAIVPAAIDTACSRPSKITPLSETIVQSVTDQALVDEKPRGTDQPGISTTVNTGEVIAHGVTASEPQSSSSAPTKPPAPAQTTLPRQSSIPLEDISPIQGRGKPWLVQLVWAVYYICGTLFYTSIVAVTVIELCVWVMTSIAVTAASKLLAFFICTAFEKRRGSTQADGGE